jgi:hypothetical protein
MGRLFVGAIVLGGAALGGGQLYDQLRRERARPAIEEHWKAARQAVADRLKQTEPLEFGAVWATHSGLVCGVVNGRGSFGGLTGMTPFAVDGNHAVFALDVSPLQFAPYWRACITDQWITILEGSMEASWCATRRGQERCITRSS